MKAWQISLRGVLVGISLLAVFSAMVEGAFGIDLQQLTIAWVLALTYGAATLVPVAAVALLLLSVLKSDSVRQSHPGPPPAHLRARLRARRTRLTGRPDRATADTIPPG